MRESKKDRRDHKYGRIKRKDRQLHDEFKKKANALWREYIKANNINLKERLSPEAQAAYNKSRETAHKEWEAIQKFWEENGLNWQEGYEDFCRFLRYHGHSNRGWIHAMFLKRRDKEFERIDRKEHFLEEV